MDEAFLGEVRAMPFAFVPTGWAACDGQVLESASNTALYALLGNQYGGSAPTTFALPALAPLEGKEGTLQYCIAVTGTFPQQP
jgi:microcystin-dependent protein